MSKLSNVVTNQVVKKTEYDKLVPKVDNIDTSHFVLKTKYNTDKTELENKIPDTSGLIKKTNYNTKITELENEIPDASGFAKKSNYNTKITEFENKIPDISNLATKTALNTVENKIPSISNLVIKTDYNTKVTEIENKLINHNLDKYIDTSEFDTLANNFFNARLAQANLITKIDFDAKLSNLNRKTTQNKSKHLLVENELNKLNTFDSGYFIGKSHFEEDGTQNFLVFPPINKYCKLITNTYYVSSWKSKGLSSKSIKPPRISDNSLTPGLNYYGTKTRVKFTGSCLKQSKISYTHGKIVNIYTVYELGTSSSHISDPTLKYCLFGAVTLTKNADID